MVLPDSDGISRVPPYSGYIQERTKFRLRGCYLYDGPSRSLRLPRSFVTPYRMSLQPQEASLLVWAMFRFARRYSGNRICFLFSRYLDVSVPWVCLPYPMYSDKDTIPLRMVGFPFGNLHQSLLTAPRSISALVPSFIDS